jgi:hypothetical protein
VQEAARVQRQQLVRDTAAAKIQQQMVKAEQGVRPTGPALSRGATPRCS